jgi:hypothetical protein
MFLGGEALLFTTASTRLLCSKWRLIRRELRGTKKARLVPGFLDMILVLFVYAVRLETNSLPRSKTFLSKPFYFLPSYFSEYRFQSAVWCVSKEIILPSIKAWVSWLPRISKASPLDTNSVALLPTSKVP